MCCCVCGGEVCNNAGDIQNTNQNYVSRFVCKRCILSATKICKCCKKCGYPIIEEYSDVFGNKIVNNNKSNVKNDSNNEASCNYCPSCENKKRNFDMARSCFYYKGYIRHLLLMLKYYFKTDCIDFIAENMYQQYQTIGNVDYICFVPITRTKLFVKGFNHAGVIANAVFKQIEINNNRENKMVKMIYDLFIKQSKTKQSKELSRKDRIITKHNFVINDKYTSNNIRQQFFGKTFLIIDDIMTTGGTLNELSKILKSEFKNCKVICLTFARTILY